MRTYQHVTEERGRQHLLPRDDRAQLLIRLLLVRLVRRLQVQLDVQRLDVG